MVVKESVSLLDALEEKKSIFDDMYAKTPKTSEVLSIYTDIRIMQENSEFVVLNSRKPPVFYPIQ